MSTNDSVVNQVILAHTAGHRFIGQIFQLSWNLISYYSKLHTNGTGYKVLFKPYKDRRDFTQFAHLY